MIKINKLRLRNFDNDVPLFVISFRAIDSYQYS